MSAILQRFGGIGFATLIAVLVSSCATGSKLSPFGGQALVKDVQVRWDHIPALQDQVSEGLTPLVFSFVSKSIQNNDKPISDKDWADEAARLGTDVSVAKSIYGKSAYIGPDGIFRKCTIAATERGLCGERSGLSVEQRADMAEQLLGVSTACEWAGFDEAYNTLQSTRLGAAEFSLHVAAKCS